MRQVSIRGATTTSKNDAELIKSASLEVVQEIVKQNSLKVEDIITVFITVTPDLTAYNPASAIRLGMNWRDAAFFTSQEPVIDGMMPRCIRILIQCYSDKQQSGMKHVYLGDAVKLRPDLNS